MLSGCWKLFVLIKWNQLVHWSFERFFQARLLESLKRHVLVVRFDRWIQQWVLGSSAKDLETKLESQPVLVVP